jgi:hypothetical protein
MQFAFGLQPRVKCGIFAPKVLKFSSCMVIYLTHTQPPSDANSWAR